MLRSLKLLNVLLNMQLLRLKNILVYGHYCTNNLHSAYLCYLWYFFFQDGTYAEHVRRLLIICATLAPIHCARDVLKMQISCVLEETKDFARGA